MLARYVRLHCRGSLNLVIESNHRITNNLALLTAIVSRQAGLIRKGPTLVPSDRDSVVRIGDFERIEACFLQKAHCIHTH